MPLGKNKKNGLTYITIVNRHYPPNPNITGESAWDLAKYLIEKYQIHVKIICVKRSDDGGGAIRKPIGEVHSIPTIYGGKNKVLKLLSGFLDGLFLIIKTLFVRKGPVIVMTSPPLLPFWASLFLSLFRVPWALWSMDLFPEFFVANGQMKKDSWLFKWIKKITYINPPQKLISLGEQQAQFILGNYPSAPSITVLPCGVFNNFEKNLTPPDWKNDDGKIYFGYCGNLGTAHSSEFLEAFIESINPGKHHLILALYGPKAEAVLSYAQNKNGVTLVKSVPRNQLHFIDVHLVSLISEWTHIAVPSKAISSICMGASMLFYGSPESDSWQMLKEASWLIEEKGDLKEQILNFLKSLNKEEVFSKKMKSISISERLHEKEIKAYEEIAKFAEGNI